MLGITYEGILRPDFVFFSGKEVQAWSLIRSRRSLSGIFGNDYLPPVILNMPDILKHNSNDLLSTNETDDLFAKNYNIENIESCLNTCSDKYLDTIQTIAKLEGIPNNQPSLAIDSIRSRMYA